MTPLQTLKAARDLISDPARWTQGWFAKNERGLNVSEDHPDACCWCVLGAMKRVSSSSIGFHQAAAILRNRSMFRLFDLSEFNDTHTHAEVLALFDAAIAELEVV